MNLTDISDGIDISIPLRFDGAQPNGFGVEPASSRACEYGSLVGDTRRGGSCNFEQITLIPHCNGTHTECVGHLTNERISVRTCLVDVIMRAVLVSTKAEHFEGDLVITKNALVHAISSVSGALTEVRATDTRPADPAVADTEPSALIVRTLPNGESKLSRVYDENNIPPYFAADAIEYIVERGFKHLLVDLPSIDRLFDDGRLVNHRIFWNVEQGSLETNAKTRVNSTITELIYVPNDVADGEYLLNLQIAPFEADAAPSRPLLFKIK